MNNTEYNLLSFMVSSYGTDFQIKWCYFGVGIHKAHFNSFTIIPWNNSAIHNTCPYKNLFEVMYALKYL